MINRLDPIKAVAKKVLGPTGSARLREVARNLWASASSIRAVARHAIPVETTTTILAEAQAPPTPLLQELISRFCVGHGIEIGPGRSTLCNRDNLILLDRFTDNPDANPAPDVVADAASIPIRDSTFDFLYSSHMLEHHQDTLRTLYEWKRILRPAGIMFLVLPHHARTLDKHRAITSLEHHVDDYAKLGEQRDYSHCEEIREGWSKLEDFEEHRMQFETDWKMDLWNWDEKLRNGVIHFHVWSQNEVVDLLRYIGISILYVADIVPELTHSFVVVGRR